MSLTFPCFIFHRCLCKRLFNRPSIKAPLKAGYTYTKFISPLDQGQCPVVKGNKDASPHIAGLLLPSGPTAISRLIVSVIVDAVYRIVRTWAWPHIGIKSLNVMQPTITYHNATSAIMTIVLMFGVAAAGYQRGPSSIFRAVRPAMLKVHSSQGFTSLAAAVGRFAAQKMGGANTTFCPAGAFAGPISFLVACASELKNSPMTKSLISKVMREGRKCGMILHVVNLLRRLSAMPPGVSAPRGLSHAFDYTSGDANEQAG